MQRAEERLRAVVPLTLAIIMLLLYMSFRNFLEVLIIMGTVPFSLIGGLWLMYWLDYNMSIAVAVGFIALAGVAVEIGVLMLVYLNQSYQATIENAKRDMRLLTKEDIRESVMQGAGLRVRPILMTVLSLMVGLIPIMMGTGTGSEVMQRIAGPMIGGMISTLALSLMLIPAIFYVWKQVTLKKENSDLTENDSQLSK
ncbi:hypothetical protein A3749_21195 [Oleiphilus sp. HI0078]|nr:hypothetical protein A3749_21195 [Oleiphilus sp. HI0078]